MAQTTAGPPETRKAGTSSSGAAGLIGLGAGIAMLVAAGLTVLTGARPAILLGLPDPGELTTVALPAVRSLSEVAMVLTIGFLLSAAFFVPPQKGGYLDVSGYRAVRAASWTASAWFVCAVLLVPLNVADTMGRPVSDVLSPGLLVNLVPKISAATAWSLTSVIALVVLVACRLVLSWGWTVVAFGLAVAGPLPVSLTGHSAAGGSHDVATDSLVLHVLGASLWVGGLAAVLVLASSRTNRDRATALSTAVPRFSALALVCWGVLAVTGVVNALVRVPLSALFTSGYGALVVAKSVALILLGVLGALHRRRTVAAAAAGRTKALVALGGVEILLMLGTIGLAVALGRSAPPDTGAPPPSITEAVIGYDLDGPPTLMRLLFDWRFSLIYGSLALLMAALYVVGIRKLRRRGDSWPVGRTIAWLCGCAVVLLATSSGVGRYAPSMFSVHMGQHMMLAMLAPILLVLGGPVTLALRALPPAGRDRPDGPREWILAAVHSPVARWLTHPLITLPLFVGSYYVLYFSSLFETSLNEHWAHLAMNAHFLLVGWLFFWPLIGIDPSPRRLPAVARLGVVFASVPFHAFFGVALMSSNEIIGGTFYRGLGLPWVPDLMQDQKLGGGLTWASGEVPLLLVIIVLLIQWSRHDERSARRDDRRADADDDADLKAYNAMLNRLATGTATSVANDDDLAKVAAVTVSDERQPPETSDAAGEVPGADVRAGQDESGAPRPR
ncbi:cytochrome c oxidase assembly protein [Pseudonocardia sp.]|uniref:cytochrome c oxidase assembly protein n=1 Tax=Pseudonocardia sp. TaxID=60912 RepID=UPI003D0DFAF3